MMEDVECPQCHRIEFGWIESPRTFCAECGWTIRPVPVAHPYGYDVLIEVRTSAGRTEPVQKHFKGSETRVRNQAKRTACYVRVLAVVALSEEQWLRAYGEGRM